MSVSAIPGWLVILSLLGLLMTAGWRARRWLVGRPASVDVLRNLSQVPHRYLVHVHEVVSRDPLVKQEPGDSGKRSARMHILTAGGFVAATVMILMVHVLGFYGPLSVGLLFVSLAMMAAGTVLVALRRTKRWYPARLSRGSFERLPWSLAAFVVFFVFATLPLTALVRPIDWSSPGGLLMCAIGAWGCLELYVGMGLGPMKHVLNGLLHLAFHPRPSRFDSERFESGLFAGGLQDLNLNEPQLGVARPIDFAWNQLLGFDACVQCGRCESACPAYAAGLPLNPKKLIQDLAAVEAARGSDAAYAGNPHPGISLGKAHGGRDQALIGPKAMLRPDTLWACTTCRACVYECPMMIEHVDAVIDLRRYQTLELGATPGKGAQVLEELRATDTVSGRATNTRLDWAADLKLPVLAERGACEVLLWIGEGGFELRGQRTLRAVIKLLRAAQIDFAVLGDEELDCGDLARRLGDEATFQDLAQRNTAILGKYRFDRILTLDPHVLHTLKNEYPALGGHFHVEHHTPFLARLVREGRLKPEKLQHGSITFHDPCYLGRYNGEIEAPRNILKAVGIEPTEMERAGMRSSCCGWGGGAAFTDVPGKRRIADVRMDHVRNTGADTVAVACPNCAVMLEGVVQPRAEVIDVAELLWTAVEAAP